jgi:hypothetical protein
MLLKQAPTPSPQVKQLLSQFFTTKNQPPPVANNPPTTKMSEPGRDSIPTSTSRLSQRPTKKRALTPLSQHASSLEALFSRPDKQIEIPLPPTAKGMAAPPEIVTNVQGSSAGAGSGEFHIYKQSRRREMERMRIMDEEVEREKGDEEWVGKREDVKKRDQKKTEKNKAKREKARLRKEKAKDGSGGDTPATKIGGAGRIAPMRPAIRNGQDEEDGDDKAPEVRAVETVGITIVDDG